VSEAASTLQEQMDRIERKLDALLSRKRAAAQPRKAKRQHRPPPSRPVDDLAVKRAEQALRRLGR